MAQVNLGRIGFVNKGSWNIAVNYKLNDVVKYGGSTYATKRPNVGITPPTNGTDTDDWFYFINNSDYVDKTSNQDITGIKNFTNGIATTEITTDSIATTEITTDSITTTEITTDSITTTEIDGDKTIDGETTFVVSPKVPEPTDNNDAVNKAYVDSVIPPQTGDIYSLGQPGEMGFGVATARADWLAPLGLTALDGHDRKTSPNYGNYMHMASGAILVCIPKHYYKITNNIFEFSDTLKTGFVIDRSFLNGDGLGGTIELPAIFVAKYGLTKNGTKASAERYKDPLSCAAAHNPISALNGAPTNTQGGFYQAVKTLDVKAILTPIFHYTMLARMAKAHGEASNIYACAYVDVKPLQPKGCNNNALGDTNDANVVYTTSGHSNCGLTGSGVPFAKTTHNGQACGVADLNGNMWEVASGFIRTTANGFLVFKDTVDIRIITDDGTGATGAYNIAHYDPIDLSSVIGAQNAWTYFGNANNQVFGFSTDKNTATYKQTSIGIPLAAGISAAGTVEFGNDGLYRTLVDQLSVLVGGRWNNTSSAGVFCMALNNVRSTSDDSFGGRASFLVQE